MRYTIHGIQHIGIGVLNHAQSMIWYKKFVGLNNQFFNDEAEAPLMEIYTKGKIILKRAAMVLNLKGGFAAELVSPSSFKASHPAEKSRIGDIGIYSGWVKVENIEKVFSYYKNQGVSVLSEIQKNPLGMKTFYIEDLNGLILQITESSDFFSKRKKLTGGFMGATIGVRDMNAAIQFYELLGYDLCVFDQTDSFSDFEPLDGSNRVFRRAILKQRNPSTGGFMMLTGVTFIELVEAKESQGVKKIFKGRQWGDIGFLHLGFDVRNMVELGKKFESKGFGFKCDTKDVLNMGKNTKVHCTYIEDPDGTLIELIEVYKIPIIEKLGIFLNIEKRQPHKPHPNLLLKALKFSKARPKI